MFVRNASRTNIAISLWHWWRREWTLRDQTDITSKRWLSSCNSSVGENKWTSARYISDMCSNCEEKQKFENPNARGLAYGFAVFVFAAHRRSHESAMCIACRRNANAAFAFPWMMMEKGSCERFVRRASRHSSFPSTNPWELSCSRDSIVQRMIRHRKITLGTVQLVHQSFASRMEDAWCRSYRIGNRQLLRSFQRARNSTRRSGHRWVKPPSIYLLVLRAVKGRGGYFALCIEQRGSILNAGSSGSRPRCVNARCDGVPLFSI